MQAIALISLCSTAILLATQTPIVCTDMGRLLLVATISAVVVCSPFADSMPISDRLIAAFIGGSALYYLVNMALGPVSFRVVSPPPRALIEMRRGAYRVDCAVAVA